MILTVYFADQSSPWVSLPGDRYTIAKHWRKWAAVFRPDTVEIMARCGAWYAVSNGNGTGYWVCHDNISWSRWRRYRHLGHALAALERLGGDIV